MARLGCVPGVFLSLATLPFSFELLLADDSDGSANAVGDIDVVVLPKVIA